MPCDVHSTLLVIGSDVLVEVLFLLLATVVIISSSPALIWP